MKTIRLYVLRTLAVLLFAGMLPQTWFTLTSLHSGEMWMHLFAQSMFYGVAYWLWRRAGSHNAARAASEKRAEAMAKETAEFFERVNTSGAFFLQAPDRIMDRADRPLLLVSDAVMWEIRSRTTSTHIGTRVKLGGVPVLLGKSVPTTEEEAREASSGELALTPGELLFVGDSRSADVRLDRIMSVELLADGVSLSVTGRQRPLMFKVANPILWAQVIKNVLALGVAGRDLPQGARLEPR